MSRYSLVDRVAQKEDWIDAGPWTVRIGDVHVPEGSVITYEAPPGGTAGSDVLQATLTLATTPPTQPSSHEATYQPTNGEVELVFIGALGYEVLLVSSMVILEDDSNPRVEDKSFTGLTVVGDPDDAGVIAAQGGG